ncbi:MAG: bifunctional 2-polyprenyl-6-hydroxyphenol methylase/3-demethylubiquinol 3-O-methyltransferase UbiG [Pseudomonadales bacterium]|nr:bifunctional 2-polyprenyl-6-hydroxyphenol methylase/3-demethylubiquinol 3-O-methyltransferase UbiG [Pseudomonadales bacterium]
MKQSNTETPNTETHTQTNVDRDEIAKFEALAHRWWDTDSEFKPLHAINPLRANFIDRLSPVAEKKVIDIGCGGGILSEALTQRGAQVTGIDMGEAPLGVAELHALDNNLTIEYKRITAEEIALERPEQYDIVTCLEMLEHVPDPAAIVNACASLCKPGGHLYFATINRNPKSYLFAILGAEHILRLLPKGTHDYEKLIKPSELHHWIRACGLSLKDSTGMTYNPLTQQYKLKSNNLDVNYLLHAIKPPSQ